MKIKSFEFEGRVRKDQGYSYNSDPVCYIAAPKWANNNEQRIPLSLKGNERLKVTVEVIPNED